MSNRGRWLAALPVFNEVNYVDDVLDEVARYAAEVLVVDDGSDDGTSEVLARRRGIAVVRHEQNRGYGAALQTAFDFTVSQGFAGVVTLDCDGQHQPQRIPRFIEAASQVDIVSGSRYLERTQGDDEPPAERRLINRRITRELNRRLGFNLTDAFCGFKAYRVDAIRELRISEPGYAMPLQLWVQAAAAGLRVMEIPVPRLYLDLNRSFGGSLDHAQSRLRHYRDVLDAAYEAAGLGGRGADLLAETCGHGGRY